MYKKSWKISETNIKICYVLCLRLFQSSKRESVSFNVGFSPLSLGRSNRLTRQQAFIQKQPQSSSQVSSLISMFEKRSTPDSINFQKSGRTVTPRLNLQEVFDVKNSEQRISQYNRKNSLPSVNHTPHDRNKDGLSVRRSPKKDSALLIRANLFESCNLNGNSIPFTPKVRSDTDILHMASLNGTSVRETPTMNKTNLKGLSNLQDSIVSSVSRARPDMGISQLKSRNRLPARDPSMSHNVKRSLTYTSKSSVDHVRTPKFSVARSDTQSPIEISSSEVDAFVPGVSNVEKSGLPTFSMQRAEHIYDEIGEVYPTFSPPPITPRQPAVVSGLYVAHSNFQPNNFDHTDSMSVHSTRSDNHIRHLHDSPDFSRQLARPKSRGKFPKLEKIKPSSLTQINMRQNSSVSEYKRTPNRLRVTNLTPVRVHTVLKTEPSPAFQQHNSVFISENDEKKVQGAGNTPKRILSRIISKIKSPKQRKSQRSLQLQLDSDDNVF